MNGHASTPAGLDEGRTEPSSAVVTARFFADLRDVFGVSRTVHLQGAQDVSSLVDLLSDRPLRLRALLGEHGACAKRVAILVNGRNTAFTGGASTLLRDGDVIDFFPPVFGG